MADPRCWSQSVDDEAGWQIFDFDKSCSHAERWTIACFVKLAFDSTSRTSIISVACSLASTKQNFFTSMAFGVQQNRPGFDFDCHC